MPNKIKGTAVALGLEILASSLDENNRTVEIAAYTGAPLSTWEGDYTLSLEAGAVEMSRMKRGAGVFLDHQHDMEHQVGVIEGASLVPNKALNMTIRFARDPQSEQYWQGVKDGIYQNLSIGAYIMRKIENTPEASARKTFLATKWQPFEVSLVGVPADANAAFLSQSEPPECVDETEVQGSAPDSPKKEVPMEPTVNTGQIETPNVEAAAKAAADAAVEAGVKAERLRVAKINEIGASAKLKPETVSAAIADGISVAEFKSKAADEVLARVNTADTQVGSIAATAAVTRDQRDTQREGMEEMLMHRWQPGKFALTEKGRTYFGSSLLRLAEDCVIASGKSARGMAPMALVQAAFQTTSDFPNLLSNVANKALRAGYEMNEQTWRQIAMRQDTKDFKANSLLQIDSGGGFQKVAESGEFKRGKIVESAETFSVATYGEIIAITRQVIINDDLSAFTRIPMLIGQDAAQFESDTVWGVITTNGNLSDSVALFEAATHKNLISSGTAISVDSIGAMRKLMRVQTGIGGKVLNLEPKFLVSNAAKEQLALQYTSMVYTPTKGAEINVWAGKVTPIAEARLDANSAIAWYMFADPNVAPVIVYSYLQGNDGVYTEQENGFDVDGVKIKARIDFGAAGVDFRGAVKNAGA